MADAAIQERLKKLGASARIGMDISTARASRFLLTPV